MTPEEVAAHEPEIVALAQRLPWKPLSEQHRRRLAAEVMAQADVAVVRSRRRGWAIAALVAAAAATVAVAFGLRRDVVRADAPSVAIDDAPEATETSSRSTTSLELPPAAPEIRDVVQLHDGELTIDTRTRDPVTIVTGRTRVTITGSRATVIARRGVIVTAQVFAGTAQIEEDGRTRLIEAGEVWTPSPAAISLQMFRTGYEQLREGHFDDAIAAFDRATDPVVLEDAQFWAAIACERAGKKDEAIRRLNAFVAEFPASPRLDDARSALERVTR